MNAILVVAGNITLEQVKALAEKWFGDIPSGNKYKRQLPAEPQQTAARTLTVEANVPLDAIYKAWHIDGRLESGYYIADLLTEIMGSGHSSRLYQSLVKEKQLMSNVECFHFGSVDKGILVIDGKLVKGVKMEEAEAAIEVELEKLLKHGVEEKELQKAKNRTESHIRFEDMSLMNRAGEIAFYELMGNAELINSELDKYQAVTIDDVAKETNKIFRPENCSTLYYYSKN